MSPAQNLSKFLFPQDIILKTGIWTLNQNWDLSSIWLSALIEIKSRSAKAKMSQLLIQDDKKGEIVLSDRLSDDFAGLYLSSFASDISFLVEQDRIPSMLEKNQSYRNRRF
jgi:hypothetical protein